VNITSGTIPAFTGFTGILCTSNQLVPEMASDGLLDAKAPGHFELGVISGQSPSCKSAAAPRQRGAHFFGDGYGMLWVFS